MTNNTYGTRTLQKQEYDYALGGKLSLLEAFDGLSLGLAAAMISMVCHNLILIGAFGEAPEAMMTSEDNCMGLSSAANSYHLVNCISTGALAYVSFSRVAYILTCLEFICLHLCI